jgi:hypothetical protein
LGRSAQPRQSRAGRGRGRALDRGGRLAPASHFLLTAEPRRTPIDLGKLADDIKHVVDERGGVDSLKEDAEELKDIATGKGSVADKAKDAVEAIKDPGEAGK